MEVSQSTQYVVYYTIGGKVSHLCIYLTYVSPVQAVSDYSKSNTS